MRYDDLWGVSEGQLAAFGNYVYIAWTDNPEGSVNFRRSTNDGATWSDLKILSDIPFLSYFPDIAISGNNVFVVWLEEFAEPWGTDVFMRRSTDNGATWKAVPNLSKNSGGSMAPQIDG